jgi:LPXTG-site transpeptidase (sortase) family protein
MPIRSATLILIIILIASSLMLSLPSVKATETVTVSIPSIGVEATVVTAYVARLPEGRTWDLRQLGHNVAHLNGTGTIGQTGNAVLAGHSELANRRASVFYNLGSVSVGSQIIVNVNGTDYRYSVSGIQNVPITELSVLYPTTDERLTLITCDPASYQAGTYTHRIVVTAQRSG